MPERWRIYGLDFTSTPSARKPITLAECTLDGQTLVLRDLLRFSSFEQWQRSLAATGPWIAAMDFPFGLPRSFVRDNGWPSRWEGYVEVTAGLDREAFDDLVALYQAAQPSGQKEPRRRADNAARALSPLKRKPIPLAWMYHAGATRLLQCGATVWPCRKRLGDRIVVEGYPALVARALLGRRPYKSEERQLDGARADARRELLSGLAGEPLLEHYGVRLQAGQFLGDALLRDGRGDLLDAVLCAIQAAWAHLRRDDGFGVPENCDIDEGWIVDPSTLAVARELAHP
jgi:hypothetical protein